MMDSQLKVEAERAGWHRFSEVDEFVPHGQKLYRSSAPNYNRDSSRSDNDATQNLTPDAIKFLVDKGIDSIISFNKYKYKPGELAILNSATSIAYLHLPVEDWHAPTREQLKKANDFFVGKKSTLVHCGYGQGRTATGVTGLQVCTTNGQTLEPLASKWCGVLGNRVETRQQMSVLAELRNVFLQSRSTGIPTGDPGKGFAIINFATGYYLTISKDNVIALSPEIVEKFPGTRPKYLWVIKKGNAGSFTFSNSTASGTFALTKSSDASIDDLVSNGTGKDANTQFTITEATENNHGVYVDANIDGLVTDRNGNGANNLLTTTEANAYDRGLYVISPSPKPDLAISIKEPNDKLRKISMSTVVPPVLAAKNKLDKFGIWVLLPVVDNTKLRH